MTPFAGKSHHLAAWALILVACEMGVLTPHLCSQQLIGDNVAEFGTSHKSPCPFCEMARLHGEIQRELSTAPGARLRPGKGQL